MPHQIIEYSSNLDSSIDIDELVKALHQTASEVEAFPLAGLRTRAVAREHYRIADAHADNGFVHVVLRVAHGRPLDVRKAAGEKIFETLCAFLEPHQSTSPLAISFEMQNIDPDVRWKKNNLRDYIAEREKKNRH
jgi:5-carboxymethyl-2-hydroxymuconate isomerase